MEPSLFAIFQRQQNHNHLQSTSSRTMASGTLGLLCNVPMPLRLWPMCLVLLTASCGSGSGDSGAAIVDAEIPAVTAQSGETVDNEVVETSDGLNAGNETDAPVQSNSTDSADSTDAGDASVTTADTDAQPSGDAVTDTESIEEVTDATGESTVVPSPDNLETDTTPPLLTEESDSTETETETEDTVELTPVALLLEEVRLAAAEPVITINSSLTSGVTLTQEQNDCLGTFDPAVGEQLTQIDCAPFDTSVSVFDSELQAIAVTLDQSAECQASLLEGLADNCMLSNANLLLPIIWVPIENPAPGQIATTIPIDGARFGYNLQEDGRLIIESVSGPFPGFRCEVDINGGFLVNTELSRGNCEAETSRLINQLFALRTGL